MPSDTSRQSDRNGRTVVVPGQAVTGELALDATDRTGRDHLARNVLASWGGHMVFVVMGFILPRILDQRLGVTALGIWDFGWSLVSYFDMAQFGVGSSVSYYVATSRTARDNDRLNIAVSSAMSIQLVAAFVIVMLTLGAVHLIPIVFHARLGEFLDEARWMVLFLGLGIAVQVACDSFRGVMTGCHHWGLHNAINAGSYIATACGMLMVLALGGGLANLAFAHFTGTVIAEVVRATVAFHISPELRIRWGYVNRQQLSDMLAFGGKTVLGVLSTLLLYQTTNVLITAYLGVAALALYSRPMALIRQCGTFVEKFAHVLAPTASSMHTGKQQSEIQGFFLQSTQYSAYLTLPPVLFLSILGSSVLHLWMGPHYSQGGLMAILACGHLMTIVQSPVWTILRGMNKHGPLAVARIIGAASAVGLTIVALGPLHQGLIGAALAITVALTILDGIVMPLYACRQLNLSLPQYLVNTWCRPLFYATPFACSLVAIRMLLGEQPSLALFYGITIGGGVLSLTYWCWVVPSTTRDQTRQIVGSFLKVPALAIQRPQKITNSVK